MSKETILSVHDIMKSYSGVLALDSVSLDFAKGEVHALVGENGAGKSTLVKILSGAIAPDRGFFELEGKRFDRISPRESHDHGIEVIYQEFNLVPSLSVAENIFLGAFIGNGFFADFPAMKSKAAQVFQELSVDIDPSALVSDLTVAEMQLVEIAKSMVRNARILIMDEPTAPLTVNETEVLFRLIRRLRERGVTIVYISHRLSEIFELSDRVTVLRDGKKIDTLPTANTSRQELIRLMVGRTLGETYPVRAVVAGAEVLRVEKLTGGKVRGVSFAAKQGEILGFAGLVGAGRTELMRLLFGADRLESGCIMLNGAAARISSPAKAMEYGIAYVPEDRKLHGVFTQLSVRDNITMPILKRISKMTVVDPKRERDILDAYKNSLEIKTPSYLQLVCNLSGGNQQKVALSKWLASECEILILDEPTRGIDVGAKQEIYCIMGKLVSEGKTILMASSEQEELIGMSDRIVVLHEGTVAGILEERAQFTQESILALASGK